MVPSRVSILGAMHMVWVSIPYIDAEGPLGQGFGA